MKRLLNICLLLSFLLCYMEWGKSNSSFIFQTEYSLLFEMNDSLSSFIHPLILIPFCGQLILLYSLFQKQPGRSLTFIALGLLGILPIIILLAAILSMNFRMIVSTVPFFIISFLVLRAHRKTQKLESV